MNVHSIYQYCQGTSKNSHFFSRARKYRAENRSLHGVNEDSSTELTPLSDKKCIFRGARQSLFTTKWYLPLLVSTLFWVQAALAIDPVYVDGQTKTAIRGYDTVAYFTQNKPIKGSQEFTAKYQGATWRFSSAENLQKFTDDPKKYAPQYGGYCAYAVARNTTASIKPAYFTILDDRLYLNYNKGVQKRWLKKKRAYIKKANKNWPGVLKK